LPQATRVRAISDAARRDFFMAAILMEAKGREEFTTARYFSKWLR
jgi:hypothetical protein